MSVCTSVYAHMVFVYESMYSDVYNIGWSQREVPLDFLRVFPPNSNFELFGIKECTLVTRREGVFS